MTVLLIGCGKTKLPHPAPARDLYTGPLFKARRAFAERSGLPWLVFSALHGFVEPDRVLHPYDWRMEQRGKAEREAFGRRCMNALLDKLRNLNKPTQ